MKRLVLLTAVLVALAAPWSVALVPPLPQARAQAPAPPAPPAPASPSVTLPQNLAGQPGIPIPVTATGTLGKNVTWIAMTPGLTIIDGGFFGVNSPKALLFGNAGTYALGAVTAIGDVVSPLATTTVTIGSPAPGPGPQPTTLQQQLQAAYATCTDPQKAANVPKVAKVFAQGAVLVANPTYVTWGDLDTAVVNYSRNTVGLAGTEVPAVIAAIQTYAGNAIPESKAPSNPISNRIAAANTYQQIAAALNAIVLTTKKGAR